MNYSSIASYNFSHIGRFLIMPPGYNVSLIQWKLEKIFPGIYESPSQSEPLVVTAQSYRFLKGKVSKKKNKLLR